MRIEKSIHLPSASSRICIHFLSHSTLLYQSGFDDGDRFFIAYVRALARYFGAVCANEKFCLLPTSVEHGAARDFGLHHGLDAAFV